MPLACIGITIARSRIGTETVGHLLIVRQRAGGIEVEDIGVLLAVIDAIGILIEIGRLGTKGGLHILRRTLYIAQDQHARPLGDGDARRELSHGERDGALGMFMDGLAHTTQ